MRLIAGVVTAVLTAVTTGGAVHAHARRPRHVAVADSLQLDPAYLDVADIHAQRTQRGGRARHRMLGRGLSQISAGHGR